MTTTVTHPCSRPGCTFVPAEAAGELFYADCDPQATKRAVDLLVPQAAGHGRGIVQAAPWERAVSHYIVCSDDRAMSPALQLRMAMRWESASTCGRFPFNVGISSLTRQHCRYRRLMGSALGTRIRGE